MHWLDLPPISESALWIQSSWVISFSQGLSVPMNGRSVLLQEMWSNLSEVSPWANQILRHLRIEFIKLFTTRKSHPWAERAGALPDSDQINNIFAFSFNSDSHSRIESDRFFFYYLACKEFILDSHVKSFLFWVWIQFHLILTILRPWLYFRSITFIPYSC